MAKTARNTHRKATVIATLAVGLGVTWAGFHFLGLEVVRTSRRAVPLEQAPLRERAQREPPEAGAKPRNIILFVADGLGFAHLSAARAVLHGIDGASAWDRLTATGWHRPHPVKGFLIDSAASATALAIGSPTYYSAIGMDAGRAARTTIFERATELGYRTGIVTDSYVWDATPAAFVTHVPLRHNSNAEAILRQLAGSSLELLIGELEDVGEKDVPDWERSVQLLRERFVVLGPNLEDLDEVRGLPSPESPVAAIFEEDQVTDLQSTPNLPSLARLALERLSSDDRPFLLLVESEEADSASHGRDFERLLRGLEAIEATLEVVLDFAEGSQETLVVFTSDHESGGLALSIGDPKNSSLRAIWATGDHTGVAVPLLAFGPGSERFAGIHATWEVGQQLAELLRITPSALQDVSELEDKGTSKKEEAQSPKDRPASQE